MKAFFFAFISFKMTSSTFVVPPFDYSISLNVAGFKYAKKEPRTIQSEVLS